MLKRRITVHAHQWAVEHVDGTLTRVLAAGRHVRPRRATYTDVPRREQLHTLAPQDVLTADGLSARLTATVRWAVTDPRAWVERAEDPSGLVFLAVQLALRESVLATAAADLAATVRSREVTEALTAAGWAAGAEVGVEVLSAAVKDVLLPPELRAAQAELVTARTRGQAQLEAARAETAALRSLANGARLLDDSPALARLRLVQALPPGATVRLDVPGTPSD